MYLVTNCESSENYLIILKEPENLFSSIDESPACISNKLAQARWDISILHIMWSAFQDTYTLLNLSKGEKVTRVCFEAVDACT